MIKMSLLFIFILFTQNVFSAQERGGGNAVVCRNENGTIDKAELLDLYEARIEQGIQIPESNVDALVQARNFAANLVPQHSGYLSYWESYLQSIAFSLDSVASKVSLLPPGVGVAPVDDSLPAFVPKKCKIEQLAAYFSTDKLIVDSEIWEALSEMQRAAFYLHETIYKVMRDQFAAKDSRRSRRIVAAVMNGLKINSLMSGISPTNHVFCHDGVQSVTEAKNAFYVDLTTPIGRISVVRILDQPVLSQRTSQIEIDYFNCSNFIVSQIQQTSSNFEGVDNMYFARINGKFSLGINKAFGDRAMSQAQSDINCYKTCVDSGGQQKYCQL